MTNKNLIFQNYHNHKYFGNAKMIDSCASIEDYANRANEFGHGIICSMEHGFQGRYIETHKVAKENNLKFIFGTEAYWVKDRLENDGTNCHIVLLAKNENGRQAINDILSEANITGFYKQPRIDLELIFSLPKNDVMITSACVVFWKYDDVDKIVNDLHNYFGNNFYLEVQYHNTEPQKEINRRILNFGYQIIMGCDSHYIEEHEALERTDLLNSKKIFYEEESGWFMDYPDGKTAYQRFIDQDIVPEEKIIEAINNTNKILEFEEYTSEIFNNKVLKLPSIYLDKTQEEKNEILTDLVWKEFEKQIPTFDVNIPLEIYKTEVQKELSEIIKSGVADYFLIDHNIIKRGKEKGGKLTASGRGSGVSFETNKILGFTKLDRISFPVKMYPERFLTAERILVNKSLPDIDFNVADQQPFIDAQDEILGNEHSYPMIVYSTMKVKSAWKMYARTKEIPPETADEVSKQIGEYELAYKYAEDDYKDSIIPENYIEKQYHDIFNESKKYRGIIDGAKCHPCAFLLYQGDIRKEIGLITLMSETTKKRTLCTIMDGLWAEKYGFLKNDWLVAKVVETIYKVFERVNQPILEVNELIKISNNNEKIMSIYHNGLTVGINQMEQRSTTKKIMKYKPNTISEIVAFTAAIRPGFASMYDIFESRKHFDYDIPILDKLIQTPEMPNTFILYQENIMTILNFAGISLSESNDVIKSISKKRKEVIISYKKRFLDGLTERLIKEENTEENHAKDIAEKIWDIIEDNAKYSYNSPHASSVGIDSLYGAYLKANYTKYFYEVFMNIWLKKGNKDKVQNAILESKKMGISLLPLKFRQNNNGFVASEEKEEIQQSIGMIKGVKKTTSENLYSLKDNKYETFVDLLIDLEENSFLNKDIETLININYFEEFGNNKKLIEVYDEFKNGKLKYQKKHTEKTKIKRITLLNEFEKSIENSKLPLGQQLDIEFDLFGCPITIVPNLKGYAYILEIDTKYSPKLKIYGISNGVTMDIKLDKKKYLMGKEELNTGDIILCKKISKKQKVKKDAANKWIKTDGEDIWAEDWIKKSLL